jgi:Na+/melibiose symporter-like transporter
VAPVEEIVDGRTQLIEQPQSETFILVLRTIFAGVPILLLTVALIFAFRYPLTPEVHARLNRLLTARRAGEPETVAMEEAAESLKRKLIG